MTSRSKRLLLVGDNPFHGVSHLSQERARARGDVRDHVEYAARLVLTSLENGAGGFMFSVSDTTLSILRNIREKTGERVDPVLYAIVPYAYEYVRLVTQFGGVSGLAKKLGRQIVSSGNVRAIGMGLKGVIGRDLEALIKTYLIYEISRIKSSAGKPSSGSLLLHEVVTDMALALDSDWLFKSYIDFVMDRGIRPGFETRNFAYLVDKFRGWDIDLSEIVIAAPFNKIGFQMNPSRVECEDALSGAPESNVIAISILAAGYLKLPEAVEYIRNLENLRGVAVGVSKEQHALETFRLLKERLQA